MYKIQQVTADPLQKQKLILPDGTFLTLTIYYVPMQLGWFITELVYGDFVLNGFRICNSPNMLYQWRNKLPFGLACFSKENREPTQQQDFSSGNSVMYLLSAAEVELYAEYLSGQI